MASNSATATVSQQSLVAYDATQIATHAALGLHARGWANVASDGTNNASFNVTSVARDAAGKYTITWATDFDSANYAPQVTLLDSNDRDNHGIETIVAGSCAVWMSNFSGVFVDLPFSIVAFGTQ